MLVFPETQDYLLDSFNLIKSSFMPYNQAFLTPCYMPVSLNIKAKKLDKINLVIQGDP